MSRAAKNPRGSGPAPSRVLIAKELTRAQQIARAIGCADSPAMRSLLDHAMPRVTSHHMVVQEAIGLIPEDASVYTQNDRFPHICERVHAYVHLPKPGLNFFEFHGGDYDYILADSTSEQCMLHWGSQASLERLEEEYGVYAEGDGVYLYKRGYEGEPLAIS